MPCDCCHPGCVPCLCSPQQQLDLILFGGGCSACDWPLGERIPLLVPPFNFPNGLCIAWGSEPVDACPWCMMTPGVTPLGTPCQPKASLHCVRGSNHQNSYGLFLQTQNGTAIYWYSNAVTCSPFEVEFVNTFAQFVFPVAGGACGGSYPTSALVVPHV